MEASFRCLWYWLLCYAMIPSPSIFTAVLISFEIEIIIFVQFDSQVGFQKMLVITKSGLWQHVQVCLLSSMKSKVEWVAKKLSKNTGDSVYSYILQKLLSSWHIMLAKSHQRLSYITILPQQASENQIDEIFHYSTEIFMQALSLPWWTMPLTSKSLFKCNGNNPDVLGR